MKLKLLTILAALFCVAASCTASFDGTESPVDYVSTLVGSMSKHSISTGNTYIRRADCQH